MEGDWSNAAFFEALRQAGHGIRITGLREDSLQGDKVCREYFRQNRYQFFHASSRGHSVPIIGGLYQQAGTARSADSSWENGVFTIEFSRGYGISALTSLKRAFTFTENTIVMTDEFVLTEELPIVERIVSRFPVEITPDGILTGGLKLVCDGDPDITIHEEARMFCIDFSLKPGTRCFNLTIHA